MMDALTHKASILERQKPNPSRFSQHAKQLVSAQRGVEKK
jgi:hypothetical protein